MKSNRRSFLRLSAIALPFSSTNQLFAKTPAAPVASKPVVVSTWDSGQISNAAAWPVLEKGGRALDAVEQAAIAIENDVNCCEMNLAFTPTNQPWILRCWKSMD